MVNTPKAQLFDRPIIGMPTEKLLELFENRKIHIEETDWSGDTAKFFEAPTVGLFIATEFGTVSCVICSPIGAA